MLRTNLLAGLAVAWCAAGSAAADFRRLSVLPAEVNLPDARSRQQLLVTAHGADGYLHDVTRSAEFESADPGVARVDKGVVRPGRKGTTLVRVRGPGGTTEVKVTVGDPAAARPVSFVNEVMAVLGKAGCNAGACHGHNSGKGGFKLSLRGYDPLADHQALTHPSHGRIDLKQPDESLILAKPTGRVSHRGGKRFAADSDFHETLRRWVAEGAKADVGRAVRLQRIEVLPGRRVVPRAGEEQQLVVLAHFADGSVRDVTELAVYELSNEGVVEVSPHGLVKCKREGEAAVFVRFLGEMGLSRFVVIRHRPDFKWPDPPANNFIDRHLHAKLKEIQVLPSGPCTDAEFLRRASLDAVGLPPPADEVRAFLADARPDKQRRKIDELLDREEFGDVWALYWLELSGTTESGDSARFKGMWTLSFWLKDAINRNLPYDRFVRALLTTKGGSLEKPAMTFGFNRLPKAEVVPQLFLGVRLQCAECHDHPFDVWKRADYQALGAFFTDIRFKEGPGDSYGSEGRVFIDPERLLPWEKGKTVRLRLPDGGEVEVPATRDRREVLADWMFGPGRKRVARALVNRVWGRLFGRGIVDPVDDMRFSNPPANESLLEALAEDFLAHKYDFKHLVRTVMNSRAYQLSSVVNETNEREKVNFSHRRLRRLSAEQLLDAVCQATGVSEDLKVAPPGVRAAQLPYAGAGSRFLTLFGRPAQRASPCECIRSHEATLPQVLHLLNGTTVARKLRSKGSTLDGLLAAKPSDDRLVEELYLHVLSRPPSDRERRLGRDYLRESGNRGEAAEDLMWVLLTSQEFLFNH
ncbi:MAG: DUF1553 domain-containing protein [Planctomycetes bacterium]|nr:DUF1553 domain-containing protein [Planctomycetota bacterium]